MNNPLIDRLDVNNLPTIGQIMIPQEFHDHWTEYFEKSVPQYTSVGPEKPVFEAPNLFPLQRWEEMDWMLQKGFSTNPKIVYEIGSDKGGGLLHWCIMPGVEKIIACENRGTPYRRAFEKYFDRIDFLWLDGVSSFDKQTVAKVREFLGEEKIDVIFIDGCKSNFRTDFDAYHKMVSDHGIIFMHDVQDSAPVAAFHSVRNEGYPVEVYINTQSTARAMAGIDQGVQNSWLKLWHGRSCGVGAIYSKESICERS